MRDWFRRAAQWIIVSGLASLEFPGFVTRSAGTALASFDLLAADSPPVFFQDLSVAFR
jgi:hypothetical protein